MNDEKNDPIGDLIRAAGRRPQPDPAMMARVRAAVHDEWQDQLRARRRKRWMIAAAAAVLVLPLLLLIPRERSYETAGTHDWNGNTLRLSPDTRVVINSNTLATLERGTLYVDVKSQRGITIRTPFGDIRDIGTKFEVRLGSDDVQVRVDEGSVELRGEIARAGETLTATREAVTKPIRLEGQQLGDVLAQVARQKGLTLDWHARGWRRGIVLRGNVPFTADEALDAATTAAGVSYRIEGGRLVIEEKR